MSLELKSVPLEQIVRKTLRGVGFISEETGIDCDNCQVIINVQGQSSEIANAVHTNKNEDDMGAGDQGLMFGYATDEWDTKTLHPYSHVLANQICEELAEQRKNGSMTWLRPDCKSQVIVEYQKLPSGNIKPIRVYNILVSTQHNPEMTNEDIRTQIIEKVINKVVPADMLVDTKIVINPSGSFVFGGPSMDAGLTGRKIIVDTYGGWCPHGGGAFSGKDASKVDRSAAYFGRYVAKSLVANGLAHRVLVQVSYAIGIADPLSIHIDSYGTVKEGMTDDDLTRIVKNNFSFRPGMIIRELQLKRPIF
jgi:S-adenosylmethionine synthetase